MEADDEVEPYSGFFECMVCFESVRGQPARHCAECDCPPWHVACDTKKKYVDTCPQCGRVGDNVRAFTGGADAWNAAPSAMIDLTGEGGGGSAVAALAEGHESGGAGGAEVGQEEISSCPVLPPARVACHPPPGASAAPPRPSSGASADQEIPVLTGRHSGMPVTMPAVDNAGGTEAAPPPPPPYSDGGLPAPRAHTTAGAGNAGLPLPLPLPVTQPLPLPLVGALGQLPSGHSGSSGGINTGKWQREEINRKRAAPDGDEGGSSAGGKRARGGQMCEHNRRRNTCKECGGSSICEHNRLRTRCKECGGGSICEHKRQRSRCKECGGSSICEHKRQRMCEPTL